MSNIKNLIDEIEHESQSTGKLLERVPEEKLSWKPHPKSMTLGQLALHVSTIPGGMGVALSQPSVEASLLLDHPLSENLHQIHTEFATTLNAAKKFLSVLSPQDLSAPWTVTHKGKAAVTIPKETAIRTFMLNHWYHHRGQLTVYLRLLGVPLPPVYAASADENPFS